jgi:hypothetical protein
MFRVEARFYNRLLPGQDPAESIAFLASIAAVPARLHPEPALRRTVPPRPALDASSPRTGEAYRGPVHDKTPPRSNIRVRSNSNTSRSASALLRRRSPETPVTSLVHQSITDPMLQKGVPVLARMRTENRHGARMPLRCQGFLDQLVEADFTRHGGDRGAACRRASDSEH